MNKFSGCEIFLSRIQESTVTEGKTKMTAFFFVLFAVIKKKWNRPHQQVCVMQGFPAKLLKIKYLLISEEVNIPVI